MANREMIVPSNENTPSSSSSNRPIQMSAGPKDKTGFIWLAEESLLLTDGQSSYDYTPVGSQLVGLGPRLEDVVVHLVIRNASSQSNFKVAVKGQYSVNGETWHDFTTLLLEDEVGDGYTISAPYTTRANFGIRIRFLVGVKDVGAQERGMVSLGVALNFLS